jgi:atlastin
MEGHPIQIISTSISDEDTSASTWKDSDGGGNDFVLNKESLAGIISKIPEDMHVGVVSVVGAFRTGKSFLLTLLLRFLREHDDSTSDESWLYKFGGVLSEGCSNTKGDKPEKEEARSFEWRGGHDRMTTGIWMWSEPFIHYSTKMEKKMAVLLMDTQGMFDNETTMSLTAQIFGISTLISSFQIYNVLNSIGEDKLQHLALFSEYGRIALQPPENDDRGDGDKGIKDMADDEKDDNERAPKRPSGEDSKEKDAKTYDKKEANIPFQPKVVSADFKPFQHLQFLVRDWPNFEHEWPEDSSSSTDEEMKSKLFSEMRQYFKGVISNRGHSDLQSTREQISRCFETVDAFLLPHPGTVITKKAYDGNLDVLDHQFKKMMNMLARYVLNERLEAKRVHTRFITGPELLNYFETYVTLFQNGSSTFPKALTMLDATADANNRNAYDLAFTRYKTVMSTEINAQGGYIEAPIFQQCHEKAVQESWSKFTEIANMGSYSAIEKMSVKLNDDITGMYTVLADFHSNNCFLIILLMTILT